MRADDVVKALQVKIIKGTMSPDEPLFVLRARDIIASGTVLYWAYHAQMRGTPKVKIEDAEQIAAAMRDWEPTRIPGRPGTEGLPLDKLKLNPQ